MKRICSFILIIMFMTIFTNCANKNTSNDLSSDILNTEEIAYDATSNTTELIESSFNKTSDNSSINKLDTPENSIYQFIQGLCKNDFSLNLYSSINGYSSCNYIADNNVVSDSLLLRVSGITGLKALSNVITNLIFNILSTDEIMDFTGEIDEEKYKIIVDTLNPKKLNDLKVIDIFIPTDDYMNKVYNMVKEIVSVNYEYRVALCELKGEYFIIGFQVLKPINDDIWLVDGIWNGYEPDKTFSVNDMYYYSQIYKTTDPNEFNSIKDDDLSENLKWSSNLEKYPPSYNANDFYRIKNLKIKTPEEAIETYIDALKESDLYSVLGTSSGILKAKGYDMSKIMNYLGGRYIINELFALPSGFDYYDHMREAYYLSDFSFDSMQVMVYLLCDIDEIKANKDQNEIFDFINSIELNRIKDLEIVDIFTPNAEKTNSDTVKENFIESANLYGAADKCERIAVFKFEGKYCMLPFTLVKYNSEWKIESFKSIYANLDGAYTIVMKVDDIKVFDELR